MDKLAEPLLQYGALGTIAAFLMVVNWFLVKGQRDELREVRVQFLDALKHERDQFVDALKTERALFLEEMERAREANSALAASLQKTFGDLVARIDRGAK